MSLGGTLGCRRLMTRPPIKRPSDRKWASFLPILELSFEAKVEVLGAWSFWSLDSPHLRVRDRTNPRSSRGKCRSLFP
ncbi:hypothetical protein MANES_13G063398v8 [Manihot esculenta]|uniref:Uncharacterized protein n=2 Tax=Manihot esculenta TaxID=3983 RepID=A0A2C9URF7_MANES|nr:hypothetical protein MANES_13G069522v8 [Manihot esculenta]OAY33059.2 hypothetical protein MANES_13G063398v8 [Manihot esculenta]